MSPMANGTAGRPRDETIERRVLEETVRQFGARGWSKLSVDRIASATGVGKASIYLRWSSKEELVVAAMETLAPQSAAVDTGSLDGDLTAMARALLDFYFSDIGAGIQRFGLDSDFPASVEKRLADFRRRQIRSWRTVVRRAIDNGWLREDVPIAVILNVVNGTVWSYVSASPGRRRRRTEEKELIAELVDLVVGRYGAAAV